MDLDEVREECKRLSKELAALDDVNNSLKTEIKEKNEKFEELEK